MLSGIEESRLYVKFDKQQAYRGVLKVSHGDDVVYVEVRGKTLAMRGDMRTFLTSLREALKR
jgi:RNA binding exosome subunit